jgi:2-polyprenyl-6-methoxyphenol hydroxylase-like FAD-dependent oxidoreductase
MKTTDLFIAGGGPAGLAVAIAARSKGLQVTLVEPARPPIDKACGEGLMPDALNALARLGIRLDSTDGAPFRGIRFFGHGSAIEGRFPNGSGMGVRRTRLHSILSEQAQAAGVDLRWGSRITAMENGCAVVGAERLAFRYLAGADGANSNTRRWAGLDRQSYKGVRLGFRRQYNIAPWSDCVEVHWGPDCQLYITPIATDCVCVALLTRRTDLRLDEALTFFPEVARRLASSNGVGSQRGGSSVFRRLDRVVKGNIALVGDASGSVDAITGEGMCMSFRQARALVDALEKDNLDEYQQAHSRIRSAPDRMAWLLLKMDRSGLLCRRALRALSKQPDLFSSLLALHVGEPSPAVLAGAMCSLGWTLLTA